MADKSSETNSGGAEPFDLDRLRELVEMMEKHDLSEVSLRNSSQKWRLRRGPQEVYQAVPAVGASPAAAPPPAQSAPPPTAAAETPAPVAEGVLIKSETVGTFYESPSPDDPPFVKVGSKVTPESNVCIIEAMKVFNQIQAGVSGTIAEVLVKNGDPVDFNTPLFRVTPG